MEMQLTDYVGPETTAELIAAFGSNVLVPQPDEVGVEEYISQTVGLVTGYSVWHRLWLFGLVEDKDVVAQRSCGDLWRPAGRIANGYYIPDDEDSELTLTTIDNPPSGAWDARPV